MIKSLFPNGSAGFAAQLFEYGYLDRIYAKPELQELSQLPSQLVNSIRKFAEGEGVYCRFFSIAMEGKDLIGKTLLVYRNRNLSNHITGTKILGVYTQTFYYMLLILQIYYMYFILNLDIKRKYLVPIGNQK